MPMSTQERAQLDANLQQIYNWGAGVDQWGQDVTTQLEEVNTWMNEVDDYGEEAERRFAFLGTRTHELQGQLNLHQRQITALRQLVTVVPVWPLLVGVLVGGATFWVVNDNSNRSNWWCAGIGAAVGAMMFAVLWFILTTRNTRAVATPPQQPTQQPVAQAAPAAPANHPTQQMPVVQPQAHQPAPVTTP